MESRYLDYRHVDVLWQQEGNTTTVVRLFVLVLYFYSNGKYVTFDSYVGISNGWICACSLFFLTTYTQIRRIMMNSIRTYDSYRMQQYYGFYYDTAVVSISLWLPRQLPWPRQCLDWWVSSIGDGLSVRSHPTRSGPYPLLSINLVASYRQSLQSYSIVLRFDHSIHVFFWQHS